MKVGDAVVIVDASVELWCLGPLLRSDVPSVLQLNPPKSWI